MKIGGFVPVSLCDYPGRVAAVVFVQGCNFRCPFCHNSHLIDASAPAVLDQREVLKRLAERRARLGGVVVTGGEPTLQPDLPLFLHLTKALGLLVKLDTNGSHPEAIEALLADRLVDYLAMDIKAPWAKYDQLTGGPRDLAQIRRSLRLIAESGLPHEFRTTRIDPLLSAADCEELRRQVPHGSTHKWQRFRPEHSLDPALRPAVVSTAAEVPAPAAATASGCGWTNCI